MRCLFDKQLKPVKFVSALVVIISMPLQLVNAQETSSASAVASSTAAIEEAANTSIPVKKAGSEKSPPAKKMVQDATLNLQTTVTGNQEQPKVLYILPWQSPAPTDVDFETLDNQQKTVFGHLEREELRRELEASTPTK